MGTLDLEESARRVGGYCWLEARLFEDLGSWVGTVPEPEVKIVLAEHARQHAWHAELWRQRLPKTGETDPDRLVAPASDQVEVLMELVRATQDGDQTIEKLVAAYRVVVPRVVAAYSDHLDHTSSVADGPVIRALHLVLRDELDHWRRGEILVQSLLRTEEEVQRAAARVARLEATVAAAGGVAGEPTSGRSGQP